MSLSELEKRCVERLERGAPMTVVENVRAVLAEAGVAEMVEALEGCLHFDDGFIRGGASGDALKQWRYAAEASLAKIGANQ